MLCGVVFVVIQGLAYTNMITVNWSTVHKHISTALDTNGDGKLDENDFKRHIKQGMVIMSQGVPSVSGFLMGFSLGLNIF